MKFAVHWAPSVNVWTPGWIGAVAAGAQAEAVPARTSIAARGGKRGGERHTDLQLDLPCRNGSRYAMAPSWGQRLLVPARVCAPNTCALRICTPVPRAP